MIRLCLEPNLRLYRKITLQDEMTLAH